MKPLFSILGVALMWAPFASAEGLQSAKVTKVINDVRVYRPSQAVKPARIGDTISGKTSLQTGRRSRSELRFQDDTITRVGANTVFSFEQGTRDLELEQGTILLNVPKNSGGARIRTATVTAAVTGTTIMMEYFSDKWVKIIVLEGTLDTWVDRQGRRTKKTIQAGQMVVLRSDDKRMPDPVDIDLKRIVETSGLVDPATFGDLPRVATTKISTAVQEQSNLKTKGVLVPVIQGVGGPGSGGPGNRGGGSAGPAERISDSRDTVKDRVVFPPPRREGDDPGR